MKTVAKRLLSLALGLCLAVAGVFTIAPTVTASAATETETMNIFASKGVLSSNKQTITWTGDNVQFKNEQANGSTAIRTSDSNHFRAYKGSKTTISTLDESNIEKIVITGYGENKYITPISDSMKSQATVTTSGSTITAIVNAPSITFSATAQWRLSKITVTYQLPDTGEPSISLDADENMQLGAPLQVKAKVENIEGDITWTSSNEEVATVDENGVVTAVALGSATITAKVGDVEDTHTIKVYPSNAKEITIAEAVEICKYTGSADTPFYYTATGTIKRIDYSYDADYDDITLTITDGTHEVKCYYLKGGKDLNPGDTIRVTGPLCLYGGNTNEFNKGSTYVKLTTVNDINAYMQLAYKYTEAEENVLTNSDFRLNCAIDSKIANVDAESYGIRVTANGKTKDYTSKTATSWAEKDGKFYVVLGLGDIVNDLEKLCTEFTVEAFAVIDGEVVVSKNAKKYSVVRMVADYVDVEGIEEVQHLYDFLSNVHGLI